MRALGSFLAGLFEEGILSGLVLLGVFGIFGYELLKAFPNFFMLVFIIVASVVIYRLIYNSKWLARYEQERKIAETTRQFDTREADWKNYQLPTRHDFLIATAPSGQQPYLVHKAHSVIAAAYSMAEFDHQIFTPAQALALYHRFVFCAQSALELYAENLPPDLKRTDLSPFTYNCTPTSEDLGPANRMLAQCFIEFGQILPRIQAEVEPRPQFHVWDEEKEARERREFDKKLKEYEKQLDEIWEAQTFEQQLFTGSSLYRFADSFAPELTQVPFNVPYKERFAGTWIIAPSGQGKTNLMWWLIDEDRKRRGTVVIMDSKGQLLNAYRGYGDAVIIDPKTARINPFQIGQGDQAIDFIEYLFSLIAVGMYPKQQSLFYPVLRLVCNVPDGSLHTFKRILLQGWRELNLGQYIQRCDQNTREFFLMPNQEGYAAFDDPKYKETKQELIWRFDLFLSKPAMQQIFSTAKSNVDFIELLDSGKTILINNNTNDLGVNGAEFFGRFFLALTWMAAIRRTDIPDADKMPVYMYIDEAQTVIANDTKVPTILDECRSQMIALTMAHQRLNRITATEVKDALFNCPVRFASVDNDAALIAHRFGKSTPEELQLSAHKFACFVRYEDPKMKMSKAVILDIPFFDKSTFPPYAVPVAEAEPEPEPVVVPEPPKKKQRPFKKDRQAINRQEIEDF